MARSHQILRLDSPRKCSELPLYIEKYLSQLTIMSWAMQLLQDSKLCHGVTEDLPQRDGIQSPPTAAAALITEPRRAAVTDVEETVLLHCRARKELLGEGLMCFRYPQRVNPSFLLHLSISSLRTTGEIETRIHFILLLHCLGIVQ